MCNKANWLSIFGPVVDSGNSVACVCCSSVLIGDGPAIDVMCEDCYRHDGVQVADRVLCMNCACAVLECGTVVTADSHPDGFTCADCGEQY